MADRYLKFAYDYALAYTAGNWLPAITTTLPTDAFVNSPYYVNQYGWYGFSASVLLPAKMRLYQQQVTFHDRGMLDMMNASYRNYVPVNTSPVNIDDINIDPTSTDMTFLSGIGGENTYVDHHYEGYIAHAELEMERPSSPVPSVSATATITYAMIYMFHDNETSEYNALMAAYPSYVTPWSPSPPADRLYIGNDPVDKVYIGDNNVNRVYLRDIIIKE